MGDNPRAVQVAAELATQWRDRVGDLVESERGSRRLVLLRESALVRDRVGDVIGVDAWVELFDRDQPVVVDPHRVIINPPLVLADGRQAPAEAFWDVLWDSVTRTPHPGGRGTVTTVFASTADGVVISSDDVYSVARAGAALSALNINLIVGQTTAGAADFSCRESFISFDTSSIEDAAEVTSVVLDLFLTDDSSTTDFVVEARESDWGASLTTGDWVAGANLSSLTLMASLSTSGIGATGAYKSFTSQAAFLSANNLKTGTVHLLLCSSRHRAGNAPSGAEQVIFQHADQAGTTEDPRLTITHDLAFVGAGGLVLGGEADVEAFDPVLVRHTGTGGLVAGGQADVEAFDPVLIQHTGAGGPLLGGAAGVAFRHGGGQVPSGIVVEVDWDNDGDFDEDVEDITELVLALETRTGRDWPSLLTGKAGPGYLRATLNNEDDRFSFFNTSSPLNTGDFSLRTGRKARVRTTDAADPDPALLARDRFRTAGALGDDELGNTWSQPLDDDFTASGGEAVASSEGDDHLAVLDVGVADYYAQVTLGEVGAETTGRTGSVLGLAYRYQDTSNYSLAVLDVDAGQLQLIDVVAGTPTTIATETVEPYDHMTIGVMLDDDQVTLHLEGVPLTTQTAIQTDETAVGIWASWGTGQPAPALDTFLVWAGLPAEVEGILWTGDVDDLTSDVEAGPRKLAMLSGRGWLSRPAGQKVRPPSTVTGRPTGQLVGATLAMARLLHPPGPIDGGDVTTGPVGMRPTDAIEVARRFEETELGFVHETQEGPIGFDSRTARDGTTVSVTFTDRPGGQFGSHRITPLDWRREVFNRVFAGVAPGTPVVEDLTVRTISEEIEAAADVEIQMPATINAGDLLLVLIATSAGITWREAFGATTDAPPGWVQLDGKRLGDFPDQANDIPNDRSRLYAKVADGSEDGTTVTFGVDPAAGGGEVVAHIYRISNWFGSIEDGITRSEWAIGDDPDVVFPRWQGPSLFIAARYGSGATTGNATVSGTIFPLGYTGTSTHGVHTDPDNNGDAAIQSGTRAAIAEVENPGTFAGTFSGFSKSDCITVAVRGFNGDPPVARGTVQVQVDDVDSQDDHNAVRTHRLPSDLFASQADAQSYAALVLQRHGDDRPVIRLSFWATKSAAYRAQAVRRRLSHRVRLVADHNAGLGIAGDFFVEAIGHRWTHGRTAWETTWELSPAPAE